MSPIAIGTDVVPTLNLFRKGTIPGTRYPPPCIQLLQERFGVRLACQSFAALFFGSLIPLAVDGKSAVLTPSLYGIGTALPVFGFALVMAFGVKSLGKFFERLTQMEKWVRKATAFVFIAAGLYLLLQSILGFAGF